MRVRPSARLLLGPVGYRLFRPLRSGAGLSPSGHHLFGIDVHQAELLAFTGLRAGEPVTRDQMQTATNKLTATGLFTGVRFSFDGQT